LVERSGWSDDARRGRREGKTETRRAEEIDHSLRASRSLAGNLSTLRSILLEDSVRSLASVLVHTCVREKKTGRNGQFRSPSTKTKREERGSYSPVPNCVLGSVSPFPIKTDLKLRVGRGARLPSSVKARVLALITVAMLGR